MGNQGVPCTILKHGFERRGLVWMGMNVGFEDKTRDCGMNEPSFYESLVYK